MAKKLELGIERLEARVAPGLVHNGTNGSNGHGSKGSNGSNGHGSNGTHGSK